ncbi:hypothetical protein MOF08_21520, partial [Bacillus licheniformis]
CETDRSLSETVRLATQKKEEIVAKRKQANRDQLAIELAKQLKEGEPCPVCGSVHHEMPAGVGTESPSFKETESELEKTEAIIAEAGALAQEFLSAKVALEQQSG